VIFCIGTLHSRHHRLYVPYAFGALYNHPVEGFLLDTLGAGLAYMLCGMSTRQGMVFFTGSTIKTVDDHCGYSLPWDPLQRITSNNASYHDIHHQSWGIKVRQHLAPAPSSQRLLHSFRASLRVADVW
jgi:sphinganine C4-monooxygenase